MAIQAVSQEQRMTQQVYLAVDLGAESGRVVAGIFNGETVRLEELHRFRAFSSLGKLF